MRFHGVAIPDSLTDAALSGSLVIFAGAGVSMQDPVHLPNFDTLIDEIKHAVDPGNRIRKRKQQIADIGTAQSGNSPHTIYAESAEQYLSFLGKRFSNMRSICADLLSRQNKPESERTSELHVNLLRLFPRDTPVKIVTTNFDECFETALDSAQRSCPIYSSPALPLGDSINGIIHLHGTINDPSTMILTAEDYGNAYVTRGWASRFLVDLFQTHYVLFIGYSCNDSLVDYLTRSISRAMSGKSFVLIKDKEEADSWSMRGVEPITFTDYSDLPLIIGSWADSLEQSITDRVRQLHIIAEGDHLSEEQIDYLYYSLTWNDLGDRAVFAREFCSRSKSFHHFEALVKRGLVGCFTDSKPCNADRELLRWAICNFAIAHCEEFQRFCSERRPNLSIDFYSALVAHLRSAEVPPSALGPWIVWLEFMPRRARSQCTYGLVDIARHTESAEIYFAILKILLQVDLAFSDNPIFGFKQEPTIAITDRYSERELLQNLKRHSNAIGKKVFEFCCSQIELAYSIQTACWTNNLSFDRMSFSRSSIGPNDQDKHNNSPWDILVDLARESISPDLADFAIQKCLDSRCCLLIRLGLWALAELECSGDSLKLIEDNDYLSDASLHHEVFVLAKSAFKIASDSQKSDFVDYAKRHFIDDNDNDNDYGLYNLCNWMLSEINDPALQKLHDEVLERNPNFIPREHPELTHYLSSGWVNTPPECTIQKDDFTVEALLYRIAHLNASDSLITPLDIVSTPARDYPDKAVELLDSLLIRRRSAEEDGLCNLLISVIPWGSFKISAESVKKIFSQGLSQDSTCVTAVDTLATFSLDSSRSLDLSPKDLDNILESLEKRYVHLLRADSSIVQDENPDWVMAGINHPAGKYLLLLTKILSEIDPGTKRESCTAWKSFKQLDIMSLPESPTAKAVIACFFMQLCYWVDFDHCYSEKAAIALSDGSWAQIPAWQGISFLPILSERVWNLTQKYWGKLFASDIDMEIKFKEQLIRLYVCAATNLKDRAEGARMLKVCASASAGSFRSACMQIDYWLSTLQPNEKITAWEDLLSESFEFAASADEEGDTGNIGVLAEFYCRWLGKEPELRRQVIHSITRDCTTLQHGDFYVRDGLLSDIAIDQSLSPNEKALAITFLLNHQQFFIRKDEALQAATHINANGVDKTIIGNLKDAYTRRGMMDVTFGDL